MAVTEENPGRWWESYFDRAFFEIYSALLPAVEAASEVDAVMAALGLRPGGRVLDLACGWGRHALELAERGCEVAALDRSAVLLTEAAAAAQRRGVRVEWVRGEMDALPFGPCFDAVVSLFSSLGYALGDEEDVRVLEEAKRVLAPDGRLLLETMHRDLVAREFVERDWWDGPDGHPVRVERQFDAVAGVSREWLHWGEVAKYHEVRVRSATEWAALLARAGLAVEDWYGDWDLSPFELDSPRLIVVARAASPRAPDQVAAVPE